MGAVGVTHGAGISFPADPLLASLPSPLSLSAPLRPFVGRPWLD